MKALEFIIGNNISVRSIEAALSLPNATISISKNTISLKHLDAIEDYLSSNYGYGKVNKVDNPTPIEKVYKYNNGRPYDFDDSIPRYQDDLGLWKRITISTNEEEDKSNYPIDGAIHEDWQGQYLILNNGIRAYIGKHSYVKFNTKKNYHKLFDNYIKI